MRLIVGLGNPGEKYKSTPHNAGFLFLDTLASNFNLEKKFNSEITETGSGDTKIIYAKPQTFMNNSGFAVNSLVQFFKLRAASLLVVHDEIDLPLGEARLAKNSSSAGHKGVQSIIDALGTNDFFRIRIGIDTRESRDDLPTEDFVLRPSQVLELDMLYKTSFPKAKELLEKFLAE